MFTRYHVAQRAVLWITTITLSACTTVSLAPLARKPLAQVRSWAIQLQGLERSGAVASLQRATVDLVVIEATSNVRGSEGFASADVVRKLQSTPGEALPSKLVLAYLNVGQAEDYRDYWREDWRAPTTEERGSPDFLLSLDPEGWPGNYPCKFWDERWKRVLFGSPTAVLDHLLEAGFDGVYLDWVLGYEDASVRAVARADDVDPARAMLELVAELAAYARARKPGFLIVAQNAAWLGHEVPGFEAHIDALAQEDLSFRGSATAKWDDDDAGGIDTVRERLDEDGRDPLIERLSEIRAGGLPILTLDYAVRREDVQRAIERSRSRAFVPTVSRTPLDRLPLLLPR